MIISESQTGQGYYHVESVEQWVLTQPLELEGKIQGLNYNMHIRRIEAHLTSIVERS